MHTCIRSTYGCADFSIDGVCERLSEIILATKIPSVLLVLQNVNFGVKWQMLKSLFRNSYLYDILNCM